jgi:hypothetical protein
MSHSSGVIFDQMEAVYLRQYAAILRQTTEGTDALVEIHYADDGSGFIGDFVPAEVCRNYERLWKTSVAQRDEALKWKETLLDQGVVCWVLTDKNKDDPKRLINDLCCRSADEALDPLISEGAQKLQAQTIEECAVIAETAADVLQDSTFDGVAAAIRALKVERRIRGERRVHKGRTLMFVNPARRSGNDRRKK